MKRNFKQYWYFALLLLLCSASFLAPVACSEKDRDTNLSNADKVSVSFSIKGINDANVLNPNAQASASGQSVSTKKILQQNMDLGNMNAEVSVETTPMKPSSSVKANASTSVNRELYATSSAMQTSNTYRVLVYDSNGTQVADLIQTAGQSTPTAIDVVKGGTYSWYAFSFNDTSNLSAVVIDKANPQVNPPKGKDLLYDSGSFTAQKDDHPGQTDNVNHQAITFNHMMSSVTVVVDASDVPAFIGDVKAFFSDSKQYFKTGSFSLKNQSFSNETYYEVTPDDFNFKDMPNLATDPQKVVKGAVFYTSQDGGNLNNGAFTVGITSLPLQDYAGTPVPTNSYSVPFGNVSPKKAYNINLRIRLNKGVIIDNLLWASGNLWYDATDPVYPYKIRVEDGNRQITPEFYNTDYWPWGVPTPTTTPLTDKSKFMDPCTKVYPENTWRMPFAKDVQASWKIYDPTKSQYYTELTGSGGKTARFYYDGRFTRTNPPAPNATPNELNTLGSFWLADPVPEDPVLFVYRFVTGPNANPNQTGNLAQFPYDYMKIRCIKNL